MITEHAPITPSAMGGYVYCTAKRDMEKQFPELMPNEETEEGNAAHWVASENLENWKRTGELLPSLIGKSAPNGILVTDEIEDSAFIYVNAALKLIKEKNISRECVFIEVRLYAKHIHPDLWGTADLVIIHGPDIYLFDFKHGHLIVSEFENWQLLSYLAGVVNWLQIDGPTEPYYTAHLTVVQPRAFHRRGTVRTWSVALINLRAQFNILRTTCETIAEGKGVCTTGPQCRDCTARYACEANRLAAGAAIEYSLKPEPELLDNYAVGVELVFLKRAMDALKYRYNALYELAEINARTKGARYPFHSINRKFGRLNWKKNKSVAEIKQLGVMLNKNLIKDAVITPTQAIKLGVDENLINVYADRDEKTVFEFDDGEKAKLIFSSQ